MAEPVLDAAGIEALIPHRGAMRLVDRVLALDPGDSIEAAYDVPDDAFWIAGHFPEEPVMPGVLIAEAMAQAAAVAYLAGGRDDAPEAIYLIGYDKLRFRRPVRPGDTLVLRALLDGMRRRIATFRVTAHVGDDRVANGTLMATLPG